MIYLPLFITALLPIVMPIAATAQPAATPATQGEVLKGTIDRRALVTRNNVVLTKADPKCLLQVGNGEFAFGVDVTGLQTFYGNIR